MAAAGGSSVGGSRRHWLEEEQPGFRSGMLQKITIKLAPVYEPRYAPYSKEVQTFVAKFEEDAFSGTNSKEDYMRNISNKLLIIEKRKDEQVRRQMQSCCNLQRPNAPQALQGGNSSVIPEAVIMASQRPSSQSMTPKTSSLVPHQHMVYPSTPNALIGIEQKHPGMMKIMDRCLNFQPSTAIATRGPGVQPGLQPMQSAASQSQSQYPVRQPQAINIVGCSPTSVPKPAIRPYSQQNRLLGIGRQQQQLTRMNQQTLGANQQELDMQRHQMLGAQQGDSSKSKLQASQLGGRNNQQDARQRDLLHSPFKACKPELMTTPLQQISGAQQHTLIYQNSQVPATMGSARECDVVEKMFCQIKSWKDAYYSQFVELDHRFAVPALTEEQFSSLPIEKANAYRRRVGTKKLIREILKLLQLRKSDVHEGLKLEFPKYEKHIHNFLGFIERTKARDAKMNIGYQLQNCDEQSQVINLTGNASPITGGKSAQQKQPADASILQSNQTTKARTPPAHQHKNGNHLLGIASPSSISSLGTLQSWSTSMLECLSPSPVTMPVVAPASPCAPVMSTSSKDVDSTSALLLHDNAGAAALKANSSNQVTPSKLTMSASPLQAEITAGLEEDQARGGDRTPVTKKPIDRLIDAMRSSSPAALRSSANSIWSVLSINDIVTSGKVGTILDCKSSRQQQQGEPNAVNKMKRVFNNTASHSESVLSGNIASSCMPFECDSSDSGSTRKLSIKRQKKENAYVALLEEIKSINSTLIDTVISMSGDCGTDGISSYHGGAMIKLSYSAVSISPIVKSLFATSEMSLVLPAKLFVPPDYPRSSLVLINDGGDEVLRKNSSAIAISVDVAFRHALADLSEPWSIKETARAWDACVRKAVTEFAHRHDGGTASSMLGRWERCAAT
ncbi:hypothetical protein ACQ4PT_017014 [Festuca glaucescens]